MSSFTPYNQRDWFSRFHSGALFPYFVLTIGCAMMTMHPLLLGLSFLGAACYAVVQRGWRGAKLVAGAVAAFIVLAALNPLFNHRGFSVLWMMGDWAITLEAIMFGGCAAVMLVTVALWFACFNGALPGDRLLQLLRPFMPATSMVLTMAMGLVPRLKRKLQMVRDGRKAMGKGMASALSILTTWALEDGLVTADAMKARGYEGKGSRYPKERFTVRDGVLLFGAVCFAGLLLYGGLTGQLQADFFPDLAFSRIPVWFALLDGCFCLLPVLLCGWEEVRWRYAWRKSLASPTQVPKSPL